MGNTPSTPFASQAMSGIQAITGDIEGARKTQETFLYNNTYPVLSQIVSAGHAIAGDLTSAGNLQKKFAEDMQNVVDSIPIAGHVAGGIYYALGDKERGDETMKASTRSSAAILGGVAGFLGAGPVGGALGALSAGSATDLIFSGASGKPQGYVAMADTLKNSPDEITAADAFDMATFTASDLVTGAYQNKKRMMRK